ncbi:MAG: MBOAT family protein [Phycisphaerae bacterium]|nr:MBOAT family protein [Phycisphaerae bacterium]
MQALTLAWITELAQSVGRCLAGPIESTAWTDWRGFWLEQILDDRFVVAWFLPLLPILLLLPRQKLRIGIILTGLAFLTYVFGVLYAGFWLLACLAFHRLGERFAYECKRTDVLKIGPPLAAILIIGGWHLGTMFLHHISLPTELNAWLYAHLRWIFPLGARGLEWEPQFRLLLRGDPPQFIFALFRDIHSIGTAYLTVRLCHYFAEIKRDTLPREHRTLLNFLAWVCYAPGLIQGPLERFAPFQDEMDTCHQRRTWRNLPPALSRIGLGILKSFVATWYVGPMLYDQLGLGRGNIYYDHPEQIESGWLLYLGIMLHITWLYLEFSGYCDVSAGIARLLGYRQIENFKRPYFATNMREFWRRWHISLSFILRDYVYIALGGNRRHVTFNLCLTFLVCGLWHKSILQVAIWGVVMGLMVAVNHHWAKWMRRLDERPAGRLPALRRGWLKLCPLPQISGWLLTQHAFLFSLLILFGGSGAIRVPREILRRLWEWLF